MTATRTDNPARDSRRVAVVAGGGKLPVEVAKALAARGEKPPIFLADGEADGDFRDYEQVRMPIEAIGKLPAELHRRGVTHVVLAGTIGRRPKWWRIVPAPSLLTELPAAIKGLASGDDTLLRVLVRFLERQGIGVLGAHEIVPEMLAPEGALTRLAPQASDWRDLDAAYAAARAIGALDIGQAAVAIGGRAIALEGIEGTDGLLARTRDLRGHGRIAGRSRGVLVKCAKPAQELRADLPTIGPDTVEAAHAAGLAGIGVETGRSLILEAKRVVERAEALGLFVVGLSQAKEP